MGWSDGSSGVILLPQLHSMKPSARIATLFIFIFFLFLNSLLVYLIIERISETKNKFGFACTDALVFSLNEYTKIKGIDSASLPGHAWIAYAPKKIEVSRVDTQTVTLNAPLSTLKTDTVGRVFIEMILNSQTFRSVDLHLFDSLFQKSLRSKKVHSPYRLDTFTMQARRAERGMIMGILEQKKKPEYSHSTRPVRFPFNSNVSVFAQVKNDPAFTRNDLLWPLLAFGAILLIGNTALLFVYRTIRKQKKINELKTDFINNMTHEMKTPLTIASAGLDALEHHVPPTERTKFYLHTSRKQMRLLNDFVERILDAAIQDIPDFSLKKERIDLHALFNELVQSHSILRKKPVGFQLTGQVPVFIQGDRLHLETAFHNVIDNAIKYSNGSVNIHIDIAENNWECTIRIRDNGMGIPPQYVKNIFEKFFRVPQGDAQSIKGFGLGLYYVKSIVEKHSGDITVHSKQGSGTEFIITLPKNA
jgi:two-component system, OmpR family, phosphate regulon sensor histidine kinase PhoR